MNPDFWIARWARNEIGFHQRAVNDYLRHWWPTFNLPMPSTVFVPMCGKSLDMRWLRERGHRVLGIDVAPAALSEFFAEWGVKAEVTQQGPFERWEHDGIALLCGDFFALQAADLAAIDAVFDRAALIALPAPLRTAYAAKMQEILPAHAMTLLITADYDQQQMSGPPFATSHGEIEALYAASRPRLLQQIDVTDHPDNVRFLARGLTQLIERVYGLNDQAGSGS
jgi:thiopurine S-methyltransferase